MKCAEETTYLWASITKIVDPKNEIRKRIFAHNGCPQESRHILAQSQLKNWNLLVYNSVIISKQAFIRTGEFRAFRRHREITQYFSAQRFKNNFAIAYDIHTTPKPLNAKP